MTGKITDLVDRINHVSRSNLVLQARFRPRQRSGHYGFQQYSPLERLGDGWTCGLGVAPRKTLRAVDVLEQ